jgi:hypothetical protein
MRVTKDGTLPVIKAILRLSPNLQSKIILKDNDYQWKCAWLNEEGVFTRHLPSLQARLAQDISIGVIQWCGPLGQFNGFRQGFSRQLAHLEHCILVSRHSHFTNEKVWNPKSLHQKYLSCPSGFWENVAEVGI